MPNTPKTPEEYHAFYRSFDQMPFAFTDIEMVFNEDRHAVDWISAMAMRSWQRWSMYH